MGVTGLWTVVQPCARPIKIETLNKKRLAVDASIWIYHFLKAVRDKEGNALRNSHVVGFYRRICKLLYFGIKPVFVFDGGAPALKRQTISGRKQRREGRREDAVRTAGKLLALQMQRRAEEEEQKRREEAERPHQQEEEEVPDNAVYVDEIQMTAQERQQGRKFKKKDQYHLPDLDMSLAEMGQPNDPRVMSIEELEQYARQFDSGEDINVYDFSKIDFDSPFFISLPASDRYNILNAARLRSRLRMGYSKDQLDTMFPDRMAFSRFQIERVRERNELTQRLMHVNGMSEDPMINVDGTGRVAGEKGREYVLVKNDGVEGGWALGVIADKEEGNRNKPIDVDEAAKLPQVQEESESDEEGDGFEDVPIEGLNRLPKASKSSAEANNPLGGNGVPNGILEQRQKLYENRKNRTNPGMRQNGPSAAENSTSLFVTEDSNIMETPLHENDMEIDNDDEELQRAIAMSLENGGRASSPEDDDFEEVFQKSRTERQPLTISNGSVVQQTNARSRQMAADRPMDDESDDELGLERAVAQARTTDQGFPPQQKGQTADGRSSHLPPAPSQSAIDSKKFDGPLPFEKLDLGSSLLGKKKMKKIEEDNAGGFERDYGNEKDKTKSGPLPPWFSGDLKKGMDAQKALEEQDRSNERRAREAEESFVFETQPQLRKNESREVIDVDELDEKRKEVIDVDADDTAANSEVVILDPQIRMGDIADVIKADPPGLDATGDATNQSEVLEERQPDDMQLPVATSEIGQESDEELLEWEESDYEVTSAELAKDTTQEARSRSSSLEFENVDIEEEPKEPQPNRVEASDLLDSDEDEGLVPMSGAADQNIPKADESDEDQFLSDEEDEQLMLEMANEAEEHARFASTFNNKSQRQSIEEYERELKALRSQQKKDRRDADEVTHIMITECQQLLKLFGLPYITAPMEAEAQCAELVSLGLVDGIVTDDSDIFLFGGTRIYKNMFNQAKFVECYLASDLEREFDLTRPKLIRLAHLLGSDYTEGLPGIGPVTALEILSEFPDSLENFKDWWSRVQMALPPSDAREDDDSTPFRRKFKRNATKLFLPPAFPDVRVDKAYLEPEVDSDPSAFQWGIPDLDALRAYLMATVGWTPDRTDEILVPVIRDMNRRENEGTQANITHFLGGGSGGRSAAAEGSAAKATTAFAPRRRNVGKSKRMENALEKLAERAREKKNSAGADGDVDVDEEDAVIAVPGSAVERDATTSPRAAAPRSKAGKRKAAAGVVDADADGERDDEGGATKKKKRPKGPTR